MSNRDHMVYLKDIHTACEKIIRYSNGLDFDTFRSNELIIDAVIRNLEVIGEAVKNLPLQIRKNYTNIDWKKIAGLRDILIHEYFGIDYELIWDIITKKIPDLKSNIQNIITKNE